MKSAFLVWLVNPFSHGLFRHTGYFMNKSFTPLLLMFLFASASAAESRWPNIVLIMSDDQGWGETGYNGHPHLKTPVLDEMAATGLRMNRFYAASPVCGPTRERIVTGCHAIAREHFPGTGPSVPKK